MGIKVYISKASNWSFCEIRNYNSLEECVEELLSGDYYFNNSPELVISKPEDWMSNKAKECDYVVEIYDTWRE